MGTNYYINKTGYHIGKSSGGWCFSLHVNPDNGINNLEDIKRLWKGRTIKNSCGSTVSKKEMLATITERSWGCRSESDMKVDPHYESWDEFHSVNGSEDGPNGLLRHKIDGEYCIGHGDGTYDYLIGKFS